MARPASPTLTKSEQAILEVLWDRGEASVREVADELSKQKPAAYTTVLTMFNILGKKGFVSYRQEGRAFIYRAVITREEARQQALDHLCAVLRRVAEPVGPASAAGPRHRPQGNQGTPRQGRPGQGQGRK